ncbi:unnamed protein product [Sphagnum jensenii]|uniref:Uncharacterized protein n=1 Tax=Sphagnum jensenii TaxID=128206 RepID=A0ABP1AHB1_9BRYO
MYGTDEVGTIYLLKESCNNSTSSHAIVEKHRKLSECLQLLEIRVQGCKRRPLTTGSCDQPSHYSTR